LNIRSIEIHPSTIADDDSPDWQDLLPAEIVKRPLQIDLVRGTTAGGAREPLGEIMAIPAGNYRQVRLRLMSNQTATEDQLPERIEGGSLLIPSETETDLHIKLKPVWALFSSANGGVRLLPTLAGGANVGRVDFDESGIPEGGVHDSLPKPAHDSNTRN
jgi:hypothetical protein